jgi:hypothetical protein
MKIQSSELRIGNYVSVCNNCNGVILPENNSYSRIFTIEFDGAKVVKDISKTFAEQIYFKYSFLSIEPIPLTEDILIKFGFKRFSLNKFSIGSFFIHFEGNLIMCMKSGVLLTTVHQFQNLYFALTKQELGIKL